MTDTTQKRENTAIGRVVSNKMNKTVVVSIEQKKSHDKYGKYIRSKSKRFAHDEENVCREGDLVLIKETRPLSKNKTWAVVKVIEGAAV